MVITGRVQGVGFRHFIWRRAQQLGVSGDVCNLPGGAVEVRASGPVQALDQLLAFARHGPDSAQVSDVQIELQGGGEYPAGFRIREGYLPAP
ncbi:MAG: acylphosphatase [Candidatus Eiseniibacteriota bacterium]